MADKLINLIRLKGKYLILLLLTYYILYIVQHGVIVFFDANIGIQQLQNWQNGHPFNSFPILDFNLNKVNYIKFNWFSPGQYLIPYLIEFIISNSYYANIILIIILSITGLIGYYKLYSLLLKNTFFVTLFTLLIVSSPYFYWNIIMYWGGENLMLAYLPWACYACIILSSKKNITFILGSSCILIIGVILKLSFVISYGGILLAIFFYCFNNNKFQFKQWTYIALSHILILFFVWYFYLDGYPNPSNTLDYTNSEFIAKSIFVDILYPFGSFLGVYFHLYFFLTKINSLLAIVYIDVAFVILPLAFTTIMYIAWLIKKYKKKLHLHQLLSLYIFVLTTLIFMFYYLKQVAVSYEIRHFYFLGNICGPSIIITLYYHFKKAFNVILFLLLLQMPFFLCQFHLKTKALNKSYIFYKNEKIPKEILVPYTLMNLYAKDSSTLIVTDSYYQLQLINTENKLVLIQHSLTKKEYQYGGMPFIWDYPFTTFKKINKKRIVIVYHKYLKNKTKESICTYIKNTNYKLTYFKSKPQYTMAVLTINK